MWPNILFNEEKKIISTALICLNTIDMIAINNPGVSLIDKIMVVVYIIMRDIYFNSQTSLVFFINGCENSDNYMETLVNHLLNFGEILSKKKRIFQYEISNLTSKWQKSNKVFVLKWSKINPESNSIENLLLFSHT